jgi:hypothetical protein
LQARKKGDTVWAGYRHAEFALHRLKEAGILSTSQRVPQAQKHDRESVSWRVNVLE